MTREEAIFFLNELRSANNCDETIDMAIAALREPVLVENGLVPCGVCGKSPTYEEFNDGFFNLDRVECRGCGVMVTSACGKSKAKWNATRGVRGADE